MRTLFASKLIQFLILAIMAIAGARALFFFFNDPEGPNLLIVLVVAAVVWAASFTAYAPSFSASKRRRFWLAVLIQILLLIGLYLAALRF